jgi:hypothetical protein
MVVQVELAVQVDRVVQEELVELVVLLLAETLLLLHGHLSEQ